MLNLLNCRPQVWAEFVTAVNLRHLSALRRGTTVELLPLLLLAGTLS
jgi:hypothetical protein